MGTERWDEMERLFAEALDRPPAERPAFLAAACAGDPALRQELEQLLAADAMNTEVLAGAFGELLASPWDDEAEEGSREAQPGSGPAALAGRTISHFRLGAPLGSGGMGVVYEAEDTRLGRPVALKFLAPELVRDPAAKARFLQEARAVSALDHTNLCTVLEAGESEDGLLFLAMPRYDGEGLERRLARGPLPVAEALDIAVQAARGLAKAHGHGIIHRDVKPGNLWVTGDGVVKILDFGIAKLQGEAGQTRRGALLGTPSYMAPEQTRGEPVDARADVWSLGVVLYEMLAGRRPFVGGSGAAVVHAVLQETPEPVTRLRPEVPAELEQIVNRMLAKDPEQRYADAAEVLADLRSALGLPTTGSLSPAAPRRPLRWLAWPALGAVALAAGVAVGHLIWRRSGAAPALPAGQIVQLTDLEGRETFPSLSPDGTFFVYTKVVDGDADLFLQRVAGGKPINLTEDSPADDDQAAFSPDGQQIAFRSEREGGGIFLMGATGESVRRLTHFGFNPAWSPDGREIAIATKVAYDPRLRFLPSQIIRIDVATGAQRPLAVQDGVQPAWSPRGLRIAFWGVAQPGNRRAIWTVPMDGGPPVTVVADDFYNWSPAWSPEGFLYFASNRGGSMNLWRVTLDESSGRVLSDPQPITTSSEWSALPSLSREGDRLIYATESSRSFVELVPFDPETAQVDGPPSLVYQGARAIRSCDVSPDGAWLALDASSPTEDLLLIRSDGSELRQLTNDLARDRIPYWSPDGNWILFASSRSGKYEAWTIRPDGSGLTQITHLPDQPVYFPFWSPDGKQIGFYYFSRGTAVLDLRPRARPRVLPPVEGGQVFTGSAWSRDGATLAGVMLTQSKVTPGVILWSLLDDTYRRLSQVGHDPIFLRRGPRLLFKEIGSIRLVDVASGEVRTVLSPPPYSSFRWVGVGPGDRNLCTVRATDEGDIWSLSLVKSTP